MFGKGKWILRIQEQVLDLIINCSTLRTGSANFYDYILLGGGKRFSFIVFGV